MQLLRPTLRYETGRCLLRQCAQEGSLSVLVNTRAAHGALPSCKSIRR